jgi:hypothetical protein
MIPIDPPDRMTMLFTPLTRPLLARLMDASKRDALNAYADDYARRSGYSRGANGEWVTERRQDHC